MNCTLGIDFGGGASKATLLRDDGTVIATHTVEYPTATPQPGWTEQDPNDWYEAARTNIGAILSQTGLAPASIKAVAFDAATHSAVLMDSQFNVLRPSIYWTDIRSLSEVRLLREKYGELIRNITFHHPDTCWTLPHLLWLQQHEEDLWKQARRLFFVKDYVRHRFTGDYLTDKIEAEGSMFFDYRTLEWSEELVHLFGWETDQLPTPVMPDEIVGTVGKRAAEETGLAPGTPILCGSTDTVMEVFASGSVATRMMTIKLATAGRICVITDEPCPSPYLINYSHLVPGLWYPGTATKSCAASFRWFRDTFGGEFADLEQDASSIPAGCSGLMFHPYLSGEMTPYNDPELRASFTGLSAGHNKAHLVRSILEGVAYSLLDCRIALEKTKIPFESKATIIGGGAQSPLWRQIIADTLDLELIVRKNIDSSLGSAMLAGVSCGFFSSLDQAAELCSKIVTRVEPDPKQHSIYSNLFSKYKRVHDQLAPIYHQTGDA